MTFFGRRHNKTLETLSRRVCDLQDRLDAVVKENSTLSEQNTRLMMLCRALRDVNADLDRAHSNEWTP